MMIEEIKETKQIVAETVVARICKCDICGKEIYDSRNKGFGDVQDHYILTTGCHDWGNDSCDSIESYDICSKECLYKKFKEYAAKSAGLRNTEYFHIDHSWNYVPHGNQTERT